MPFATTRDNVRLYYEEAGSGTPLLFVHEFAGDWRTWEPQMRYFARRYRCITFSARGYHPSDVPHARSLFSYEHFRRRLIAVLDHLKIDKAHIVGLSMGGYATLCVGHAVSGARAVADHGGHRLGLGTRVPRNSARRREATAKEYDAMGSEGVAKTYGMGPARMPFEVKDPRGYKEFYDQFAEHGEGRRQHAARLSGDRPPIYEFEADIKKITLPSLIICGDEDDPLHRAELISRYIAPPVSRSFPRAATR